MKISKVFNGILLLTFLVFLSGCATQSPVKSFSVSEKQNWTLGEGPMVSELIKLPQENIKDVALRSFPVANGKEKFETDEEFKKRSLLVPKSIFITAPIKTSKENNCETFFDHEKTIYAVKNCLPVFSKRELMYETVDGDSFALANMFDSRTIKKKLINRYFLMATIDWNAEFVISKTTAKELDEDLMVGIVVANPSTFKNCGLCESRELQDSLNDLSSSLAGLQGKRAATKSSWRDDAFKEGELLENWNYNVQINNFSEVVIFRKKDQKILDYRKFIPAEIK